ncbi:ABC transporter substrate-binding protein [Leptolyngbya sp. AN03gr2]|uniref:ABC transporter substrate-binding protein n=1 Tax=unclassified Leptolyngbya TaxID=2650499 RepID=UPI003D31873B
MFRRFQLVLLSVLALVAAIACRGHSLSGIVALEQPASDCRIVQHALGQSCVPNHPQRVVVLDPGSLGNAFALGIKPVGAAVLEGKFPTYLQDKSAGVTIVGTPNQPNLEAILLLKPDLILGDSRIRIYDQLSRIAPTVLTADWDEPEDEALWKRDLKLHALALGKTEVAEKLLQAYQQRTQALRTRLSDRPLPRISVTNFRRDQVRIYLNDSFSGTILQDVGLPRPSAQAQTGFVKRISLETIPSLDGDAIFAVTSPANSSLFRQFQAHPLWFHLNAVKLERVVDVSDEIWVNGWHILGANLVLDDLFKFFLSKAS